MRFKGNPNIILYSLIFFLIFLFYRRDILDLDISKYLFIVPIIVSSLVLPYQYTYSILALIMPLSFGLSTGYLYPILISILYYRKRAYFAIPIIFVIVSFCYEFVHYPFYSFVPDSSPNLVLNYLSTLFLVALFFRNEDLMLDKDLFIKMFCIGSAILCLFIVWHTTILIDSVDIFTGNIRIGDTGILDEMELSGKIYLRANANNMAYFSIVSISLLLIQFFDKRIPLIEFIILIGVLFLCGLTTMSRTWFICLAILLFTFFNKIGNTGFLKTIFFILIAVGGIYFIISNEDFSTAIIERFTGDKTAGGRTSIFAEYNDFFFNHPAVILFGTGVLNYKKVAMLEHSTHNAIQQIYVCNGLIGGILLIGVFFFTVANIWIKRNRMVSKVYLLPLIISILFLQTLQILNPCILLLPLIPSILMFRKILK